MKLLVVDDEPLARKRLIRLLGELPDVQVVGEAEDGLAALEQIRALTPDLVLLDIQMPGLDGLALARRWGAELPPLVFVTAHDAHALEAFEVAAVDYLLKPVRPERLAAALQRVRSRLAQSAATPRTDTAALEQLAPPERTHLVTSTRRGEVHLFDGRRITRFQASEKYTVFLVDGREQLTEEPLSSIEARLARFGFLRVHRGELVRLEAVQSFRSTDGIHELVLVDGQVVRVSRRSVAEVRQALGL